MQKYLIAFVLENFFYIPKLECTKNTINLFSENRRNVTEKLSINLLNPKNLNGSYVYIRRIAKIIFSNSYTQLSTAQKRFLKIESISFNTYRNLSFTTYKNVKEYALGIRLYTSAIAICLSRSMGKIGMPVEGEAITTIRLSAKQSVASS